MVAGKATGGRPGTAGRAGGPYLGTMAQRGRGRLRKWREVRPGLWLIAGLTAVSLTVFFLDEIRRAIEEGPRLVVASEAAPELEAGADVWVAGRSAGRVLWVRLRDDRDPRSGAPILLKAALHRDVAGVIRRDATARITQAGVMAPTVLSLDPGNPENPPFDFRDTLRAAVTLVDQDRTLALLDTLRAATEEARPLRTRLRDALDRGGGTAAALRRDTATLRSLERRLEALDRLLFGSEGRGGSLGRMMGDTTLAATIETVAASLDRLSAGRDSGTAGTATRELLTALDGLQASLAALERDLRAGRGALGRALYDTAIVQQARLLEARMDSLRRELLENPLRWLRFRVF